MPAAPTVKSSFRPGSRAKAQVEGQSKTRARIIEPTILEAAHVPGYDRRASGACDGGDLAIGLAYGSYGGPPLSGQHYVGLGSIT